MATRLKDLNENGGPVNMSTESGLDVTKSTWTPEETAAFFQPVDRGATFAERGISRTAAPAVRPSDSGQGNSPLLQAALKQIMAEPKFDVSAFSGKAKRERLNSLRLQHQQNVADSLKSLAGLEMKEKGATTRTGMTGETNIEERKLANEGALDVADRRNAGALGLADINNAARLNETNAREAGADRRLGLAHKNALALEDTKFGNDMNRLGRLNDYAKESDIRSLGLDAFKAGASGKDVQPLVNNSEGFTRGSLASFRYPKVKKEQKLEFISGDPVSKTKDRMFDPNTGTLKSISTFDDQVAQAETTLGENFDPTNPSEESRAFLIDLAQTNRPAFDRIMQRYRARAN